MKAKKSLQKFTKTDKIINNILSLKQITRQDIEPLSKTVSEKLFKEITELFNKLEGVERDKFYYKIEQVITNGTKNQMWEYNHNQITAALSNLTQNCGRIPSNTELAKETGLSRQTVHKHMKEYLQHPLYLEQLEQFKFMSSKVLAKVFKFAVNGDMGAAKLFFNVTGSMNNSKPTNGTTIQNQNNYIQINGTVLSQEAVKQLKPEQLKIIESILKEAAFKQ
jgi:predicted DNA-binding protein YlxM (UPF0122 family)